MSLKKLKNRITIEVRQQDWIPGFAAYATGSLTAKGRAHVVINVGGLLATVAMGKVKPSELPYMVAESLFHEFVHVLQEWAGQSFSEKKIEKLVNKYHETYRGKK